MRINKKMIKMKKLEGQANLKAMKNKIKLILHKKMKLKKKILKIKMNQKSRKLKF